MRSSRGYGTYRGRGGFRTFLKILISLLAVALVLLTAAYFFLRRFAVVTDDGIRYDIPFLQRKDPPPAPSAPIIIETPTPTVTPEPEPEPEPSEPPLHAVSLPRTALYDGTASALVDEAGGNAALFDMKGDDGTLGYVSELELAKTVRASDSNPAVNAAIKALTGSELYTVARVSCFKDNTTPYRDTSLAIKTNSGYNWKDAAGDRWASPNSAPMRQYLADLCVELARLGFDEILLDNAQFPTTGHLDYIKVGPAYDKAGFADEMAAFYRQVREALSAYPEVTLSIRTSAEALTGADALSGQTASNLATAADRIWVVPPAEEGTDYAALLTYAGLEGAEEKLVLTGDTAEEDAANWAILK